MLSIWLPGTLGTAKAEDGGLGISSNIDLPIRKLLGKEPAHIRAGVGAFNIFPNNAAGRSANLALEYRFGQKLYSIGPLVGLSVNTNGGVYGYGGICTSFVLDRVLITPSLLFGGYAQNDSNVGRRLARVGLA